MIENLKRKWGEYPDAIQSLSKIWDLSRSFLKYSLDLRILILYSNALIRLADSGYWFGTPSIKYPCSVDALLKGLYVFTFNNLTRFNMPEYNWDRIYGELSVLYRDRLPQ